MENFLGVKKKLDNYNNMTSYGRIGEFAFEIILNHRVNLKTGFDRIIPIL